MNEVETYAERIVNENMHVIGNLKPFPDESCDRYRYIIIDTEDLRNAGYETSEAYPKNIANAREDINAVFVARELPYKATVKSVNVIAIFRCDESNANIIEIQKNIETGYGDCFLCGRENIKKMDNVCSCESVGIPHLEMCEHCGFPMSMH